MRSSIQADSTPLSRGARIGGSVDRIAAIAGSTLLETSRRRVIVVLVGLTVAAIALTGWGFSQLFRFAPNGQTPTAADVQLVSVPLLIMVMFMFSFVFALVAVFVAAPAVAGDLESGIALALLARPLARWELLLGRWLGLAVLVAAYVVGATALELGVTAFASGFSPPDPIAAIGYLVAETLTVLTLAIVLSTRLSTMTTGIAGLLLFGTAWVAGVVGGIGTAFGDGLITDAGTVASMLLPTDGLWRGAIYAMEPPQIVLGLFVAGRDAAAFPFFVSVPPTAGYLGWCAAWIAAMLALAMVSLDRREL